MSALVCSFTVAGEPQPKGSVSAFPVRTRAGTVVANVVHPKQAWVEVVGMEARAAMNRVGIWRPLTGAMRLEIIYYLRRGNTVKRALPSVKPDVDKLERAVLDGLTGVVFVDDAQVTDVRHRKRYADWCEPGIVVEVYRMEDFE